MLGIDVSKATLACSLLDPVTKLETWSKEVPNSPAGIKVLLNKVPAHVAWTVEPTGRYSQTVVRLGSDAGRCVLLAQPQRAKRFLSSVQSRAKTDRLDSKGLALYGLAHKLPAFHVKTPMLDQIDQLLTARKGISKSITALSARARELPYAADALKETVALLKKQHDDLNKQIKQLTEEAADSAETSLTQDGQAFAATVKEMQRVPGIGPVVATTVVSRLTGRDFANSDKFVAYCGLDVTVRQSGTRRGSGGLTKQGDSELRRLLYLAAQASLRNKNSPFRMQYERELKKGLSTTAALCSIARKMARLCWALTTKGHQYDPSRIYQQPAQSLQTASSEEN